MSPLSTLEVRINSKAVYFGTPGPAYDAGTGQYDYSLPLDQMLEPGTYEVKIKAFNELGNFTVETFSYLNVVSEPARVTKKLSGVNPKVVTPLRSVDLSTGKPAQAQYQRSDFCHVPRACVIGEAMVAWVLADALMEKIGGDSLQEMQAHWDATFGKEQAPD